MEEFTEPSAPMSQTEDTPTDSTHYIIEQPGTPPPSYYEARYTRQLTNRSLIVPTDTIDREKPKSLSQLLVHVLSPSFHLYIYIAQQCSLNLSTEHLDCLNEDKIIIDSKYIRLMDCIGQGIHTYIQANTIIQLIRCGLNTYVLYMYVYR